MRVSPFDQWAESHGVAWHGFGIESDGETTWENDSSNIHMQMLMDDAERLPDQEMWWSANGKSLFFEWHNGAIIEYTPAS